MIKNQQEFKREAKKIMLQAKSSLWAHTMFKNCEIYCMLIKNSLDKENSQYAISAFSKALITDYSKIFSSESREGFSTKYITKSVEFNSEIHKIILNLRNTTVSHSDSSYEGQEMAFLITNTVNPNITSDGINSVDLPIQIQVSSTFFMGFTSIDLIEKILKHLKALAIVSLLESERLIDELYQFLMKNYRFASMLDAAHLFLSKNKGSSDEVPPERITQKDYDGQKNIKGKGLAFRDLVLTRGPENLREFEDEFIKVKKREIKKGISYEITFKK